MIDLNKEVSFSRIGFSSWTAFDYARTYYHKFKEQHKLLDGISEDEDPSEYLDIAIKMDEYGTITVILAVICIEALIYEYAAINLSDSYAKKYLENLNICSKWVVIPKLVTGKAFPVEKQGYEQLKKLVKYRNSLVHTKTAPYDPNIKYDIEGTKDKLIYIVENTLKTIRLLGRGFI
ncbi:MAG: hypothetical protein R3F48_01190 [Candidatus Zixiibacteriota bacterium]